MTLIRLVISIVDKTEPSTNAFCLLLHEHIAEFRPERVCRSHCVIASIVYLQRHRAFKPVVLQLDKSGRVCVRACIWTFVYQTIIYGCLFVCFCLLLFFLLGFWVLFFRGSFVVAFFLCFFLIVFFKYVCILTSNVFERLLT